MYTWVLLGVRARLTRHWKNAFFSHNKKGDWSCIIHFVSIFLCKVFETSLTWLSYHLFILQGAVLCILHQRMALCCATTLNRTRFAKFNVNTTMDYGFEFDPAILYYCFKGEWNFYSFDPSLEARLPWPNCTTSKCD